MMKYGWRIVYHKDIEWCDELENCLLNFVKKFSSEDSYKCRKDSGAYYRRNYFGRGLDENFQIASNNEPKYTFKRLSTKRRIFGIVPITELESDQPLKLKQCMCAIHRGGQRVRLKIPYNENDYITFKEVGEIKG